MSVAEFAESIIDTSAQQARSATAVLRRGKYLRTDGSDIVVEVAGGEVTVTSALTDGQTLVADEPVLLLQQGYEYVLIKPSAPVVDTSGFVERAGDTMEGVLNVVDPTTGASAVPRYWVEARGSGDLVTNGTGYMESNYNWNNGTIKYVPEDAPAGATGSFEAGTPGVSRSIFSDEYIPVVASNRYELGVSMRQANPGAVGRTYSGFACYDAQKNQIAPLNYWFRTGTTTTLAQPLNPGDNYIYLTSVDNWYQPNGTPGLHYASIIFWNWVDPNGRVWPQETYSREYGYAVYSQNPDTTNKRLVLDAPWAGKAYPAGHPVSNVQSGGTYNYVGAVNAVVPETWADYGGIISGEGPNPEQFRPGTAFVKFLLLIDRDDAGSKHRFSNMSLRQISDGTDHGHDEYVPLAGGTMTGQLILPGDPTFSLSAATKQFAESIAASEADAAEAAAKAYADTTFPTKTGTGASGTWPISVSGNADTVDGLHVHNTQSNQNSANQIVRTNSSGYTMLGYINSSNGNEGNNSFPARVWGTNGSDSYMRSYLSSQFSQAHSGHAGLVSSGLILSNRNATGDYTLPGSGTYYTVPGCSISIAGPASLLIVLRLTYNAASWTNVVNIYARILLTGAINGDESGRARFGPAGNLGSSAEQQVMCQMVATLPAGTTNIYGQCYQSNTNNSLVITAGYSTLSIFGIKHV